MNSIHQNLAAPSKKTFKVDRRVLRTQETLQDALTRLLQEKPLHSISVAELTREANINRATFYLHYTGIYHMVESIQRGVYIEVASTLRIDDHDRIADVGKALVLVFQRLSEQRAFFAAMFGPNGDSNFTDDIITYIWNIICNLENSPIKDLNTAQGGVVDDPQARRAFYKYVFYASGFIGLIKTWTIEGEESAQEMSKMALRFIEDISFDF